jgi:hypothetical protein
MLEDDVERVDRRRDRRRRIVALILNIAAFATLVLACRAP